MSKPYSITTALPYVNGKPHLGYALEAVQADVLARYHRLLGDEVVFNIGTDEHGLKIYEKAQAEGKTSQEYCDEMSAHFRALKESLDISYTHFIRTTDAHHVEAAQEFWKRCAAAGDIYKKQYQAKYCVGCELEKTDSDLDHGKCPDHPNLEIQLIEEENYFFRFSKYQEPLLKLYDERPDFVVPANRLAEIRNFAAKGLTDFSISRLKEKLPWGIPVPGDDAHVMYVWFDALVNYVSTLGWPACAKASAGKPDHRCGEDSAETCEYARFWPSVQIAGKDNLRQQSAMWQAMLLSAGLPVSRQILIHGHIMSAGQKMSKSLGNVISPDDLVARFGADGTRYLLLAAGNLEHDPDVTVERLTEKYNADLANGLGNLVSRVIKLSEKLDESRQSTESSQQEIPGELVRLIEEYRFADAMEAIVEAVREANKRIDETKPWELAKTDAARFATVMTELLGKLAAIADMLEVFLPGTSEKIRAALQAGKTEPLFLRVQEMK